MTAPRITRTTDLRIDGRDIEGMGGAEIYVTVQPHELPAADALAAMRTVRVTIEPVLDEKTPGAAYGSALDYLAEVKALLNKLVDPSAFHDSEEHETAIRRCKQLAESASLAILDEMKSSAMDATRGAT